MAYYEELDEILNVIISKYILTNQNICKLLYYYPKDYDLSYDPLANEDIKDTSKLLLDYIYPMPKSPDAETQQKGFLTVVLTGGDYMRNQNGYRTVRVVFDIVFHLKSWIIKKSFRPYKILSELDKMFNNKKPDLPIIGSTQYYDFNVKDYSSAYYGIQVIYDLTLNSNIDCSPEPKNINLNKEAGTCKPFYASKILKGKEN